MKRNSIAQSVTAANSSGDTSGAHGKSEPARRSRRRSAGIEPVKLLDVPKVTVENPLEAIKTIELQKQAWIVDCDILIAGGGIGGCAAALRASMSGLKVCLSEETDWLGGQMTSQGVSALDENYLVETSGATLKYLQFRRKIREHYRSQYQLSQSAQKKARLNPGSCWVSRLSFEPKVAVATMAEMIRPAVADGSLSIYLRTKPVAVHMASKKIRSVTAVNVDSGETIEFRPKICLDATELGELLPLCKADYRVGCESQLETNEPHASLAADPSNVQDFVYPFAIEFRPGEDHTINMPPFYDRFKDSGAFSFSGFKMFEQANSAENGSSRQLHPFWTYRRLLDRSNWVNPPYENDLAMINWASNDLRGQNFIDEPEETAAQRLALGKALSLGFLYWLQTEAPRDDGGRGYKELLLRPEVMGTSDGLSKYPYIRESRRIKALHTIVEQDVAAATNSGARARAHSDSVGIGYYPIDIHGEEEKPGAGQGTRPFQVPLASLIPEAPVNLIASAKNIGTTHITNGAYRLHPVEWAIGEAAGALAVLSVEQRIFPRKVTVNKQLLRLLQRRLCGTGTPVYWYDDVPVWHQAFPAIQFLSITGIMQGSQENLKFKPREALTRGDAAAALSAFLRLHLPHKLKNLPPDVKPEDATAPAIAACLDSDLLSAGSDGNFNPSGKITWGDLAAAAQHKQVRLDLPDDLDEPVTRAEFAKWLYEAAVSPKNIGRL